MTQDVRAAAPVAGVYRVSDLVADLRAVCAEAFGLLWVEGEISGLHQARSGHVYFELKDEAAVLRAVLFRAAAARSGLRLSDGLYVRVRAQLDLYPSRGQVQLIVDRIEPAGEGALALALSRLKQRLQEEGLFDAVHKQPLPSHPRRIGVVTSLGGAAVHDFVSALRRRRARLDVVVYDARVQGEDAWRDVVRGLHLLASDPAIEVIVLTRGGGSLQDLWTFQREEVVRAIFALATPVISAVGHETDAPLTDWVADARAATPTAAAVLVSADGAEVEDRLRRATDCLLRCQGARLAGWVQRVRALDRALIDPRERLRAMSARLQASRSLLRRMTMRCIAPHEAGLATAAARLSDSLEAQLERERRRIDTAAAMLSRQMERAAERANGRLEASASKLDALSPLRVLARGYGIARRESDKAILRSTDDIQVGERLELTLAKGKLAAVVASKQD